MLKSEPANSLQATITSDVHVASYIILQYDF